MNTPQRIYIQENYSQARPEDRFDRLVPLEIPTSGLLRCGVCGRGYSKINATQFGCATARNKGACGNRRSIRRDAIEAVVLNGLKHRFMDPELFKVFVEEFTQEFNRLPTRQAVPRLWN